ncbi:DUF6602 domain-containing protein [Leptospira sp. GIMC2001]|uniref:DUF6602 domain-containing protein n=1 Tax=Leptospira sp. GIMC2001 TaxID=1513297 RepID=UPI00234B3BFA|nr:DUF6602 domain-containing protein [Leptospira sp. GIMC2001]WCL51003.1 hypothetical protein O4O04_09385 [Leptospira sp. GIMC2001]
MSLIEYHKTTTKELLALTNKVRYLIKHWGEDGRHKEAVLKNVIKRFLPEKYIIGTGFVIKQNTDSSEHASSRQIDLIIYDNSSPVLFKEGDFVILTPDAVRGIIEVKANIQNQGLTSVLKQANENGNFIFSGKDDKEHLFFNGVFSYEGYGNDFNLDTLQQKYKASNTDFISDPNYHNFLVNHVSLNKDWFIKTWINEAKPHSIYKLDDLSFPFFISNLIDILADKSISENESIWYAANKELNRVRNF